MIDSILFWLWILFAVGALAEIFFFLMQRSALELCRTVGLSDRTRFLIIPRFYRFAWWAITGKWLAAVLLAWYGSILIAAAVLVGQFILMIFVPVPHRLSRLHSRPGYSRWVLMATQNSVGFWPPFGASVVRKVYGYQG